MFRTNSGKQFLRVSWLRRHVNRIQYLYKSKHTNKLIKVKSDRESE